LVEYVGAGPDACHKLVGHLSTATYVLKDQDLRGGNVRSRSIEGQGGW
jgi:hypothetical protein